MEELEIALSEDQIWNSLEEYDGESSDKEFQSPKFGDFDIEREYELNSDEYSNILTDDTLLSWSTPRNMSHNREDKNDFSGIKLFGLSEKKNVVNLNIQSEELGIEELKNHLVNEKDCVKTNDYIPLPNSVNTKNNLNPEYIELQIQVSELLRASERHQEEVHLELDKALASNEVLKKEIDSLKDKLGINSTLLCKYKLESLALSAQIPYLKSIPLESAKQKEVCILQNKVGILEEELEEANRQLVNYGVYRQKCIELESELNKASDKFAELEKFQTEQLKIAEDEIRSLTEIKDKLFSDLHNTLKENDALKLTNNAIMRIDSTYKSVPADEDISLELLNAHLDSEINELSTKENSEVISEDQKLIVFEICRSIIPKLSHKIAEEMVHGSEDNKNDIESNSSIIKRIDKFIKRSIGIQAGFPQFSSTTGFNDADPIFIRNEVITLRNENKRLKKENQSLKNDMKSLNKRIVHRNVESMREVSYRTSGTKNSFAASGNHAVNIKNPSGWASSIVNEVSELEERCNKLKMDNLTQKPVILSRESTNYNSTVASFEDLKKNNVEDLKSQSAKKSSLNELNSLREKLVTEGILL
ncbi:uncharacterized protein CMU_018030 [Cryptosporidium muris RN66]|uniref:Uncharacterized protein n=1 Tax=Cryptosporidium muris (strain RN66) TaxID=441375 RepID=B6AD45_CRYMR|nr:uncharacterized protein CMU_018030 [Cryptosporidium muris RN66]EEA06049.1 hypothetical protein, conserved [Cryptosporidium muris RN66]|eukprot:XP_002140398.1 hypothetical protein [Cryptosporidium muris RN66]